MSDLKIEIFLKKGVVSIVIYLQFIDCIYDAAKWKEEQPDLSSMNQEKSHKGLLL